MPAQLPLLIFFLTISPPHAWQAGARRSGCAEDPYPLRSFRMPPLACELSSGAVRMSRDEPCVGSLRRLIIHLYPPR
jgi:hypothetical protein